MSQFIKDQRIIKEIETESIKGKSLYERFGGRPTLEKVHKLFYDKLYRDPWLKQFFTGIDQKHIENQQSDFIAQLTGGPKNYMGKMPIHAHRHMFLTEDIFALRHEMLRQALTEAGVKEKEREEWLKLDQAFKKVLVKTEVKECEKRYATDEIVNIPKPGGYKIAS